MFRPLLWPEGQEYWGNPFNKAAAKPQDAREVWFTGVHCDVGGGYPEEESGLAKLPLEWMIEQVTPTGLHFNTRTVHQIVLGTTSEKPTNSRKSYVAPNPDADPHNSMNWAWAVLEFLPRRRPKDSRRPALFGVTIPFFERRNIPDGARIHQSVLDRAGGAPGNLPPDHRPEPWNRRLP
jgi:hypothetical protein